MYYSNAALKSPESFNNRANTYVVNEILNATPQQLLIKVYDFAIGQCKRKNIEKTNKALMILIDALKYDSEAVREISIGLRKLYEFCQDQIRKNNFDIALQILTDLRDTWSKVFTQS
jgi:flagellar secretion chaperone FliS